MSVVYPINYGAYNPYASSVFVVDIVEEIALISTIGCDDHIMNWVSNDYTHQLAVSIDTWGVRKL
jgi:hypothetical protein